MVAGPRFEHTNLRRSGLMPIAPFSPARRTDSRHGGNGYSRLSASCQTLAYDRDVAINTKRPPGLFPLFDRSTTLALRSAVFAGRSLDAKRARYQMHVVESICARGVGYGFCLKCRQGFGASRIQLMSASGSTSTFVWILRIRKSEWPRGSGPHQRCVRRRQSGKRCPRADAG
jgi:hypothetical protein